MLRVWEGFDQVSSCETIQGGFPRGDSLGGSPQGFAWGDPWGGTLGGFSGGIPWGDPWGVPRGGALGDPGRIPLGDPPGGSPRGIPLGYPPRGSGLIRSGGGKGGTPLGLKTSSYHPWVYLYPCWLPCSNLPPRNRPQDKPRCSCLRQVRQRKSTSSRRGRRSRCTTDFAPSVPT